MVSTNSRSPFTGELDGLVQQLLRTWHVPGLAIAVIDGHDTFSKGYGTAVFPDVPVTPETVFFTASTTKSFTAASVSLLIEDSMGHVYKDSVSPNLSWTSTLSSVIPDDFALADEYTTAQVTFEDALSNRTGLPDHKLSFKPNTASVKDVVRSLRYLPRAAELREKYLYSSYMFSTVSHAIETTTGTGLGDFMRARLWHPLGMKTTYWTPQEATAAASSGTVLAQGYAWDSSSGKFVEQPIPDFPAVSGAGAMISNVVDYTKWLRCMMAKSAPLSQAAHQTLTEPRIQFSQHPNNVFPSPHSYALGWTIDYYRGQRIVWHGGSWTGFGSTMMYLPDLQWGLVMMGNTTGTSNLVQTVLYMHLLDNILGTPLADRVDWNNKLQERINTRRSDNSRAKSRLYPSLPSPLEPPSAPFKAHAGRYSHPGYGDMNIESHENVLIVDRLLQEIPMIIRMIHVSGESWLARLEVLNQDPRDFESVRATFRVSDNGVLGHVGLDLEPALGGEMIWFDRVSTF
ncbi:beta-lactamase/transpeptidase-like protein [Talaromyces proteolyticus]|uniref:Beta-lactamase/transpeptidase-like protein n=1 Tax=Talaromyces proteolyticus TaxID=1131652 RepID=A0AAD4KQI5_9EURO|nr:beta-lactamase/transpeptidase-like protein [Talaromyces proteolyticus]KAH8697129.1 beta-lactamase/transpeptidase-like protein [Talaromyces proteolyticus]